MRSSDFHGSLAPSLSAVASLAGLHESYTKATPSRKRKRVTAKSAVTL